MVNSATLHMSYLYNKLIFILNGFAKWL